MSVYPPENYVFRELILYSVPSSVGYNTYTIPHRLTGKPNIVLVKLISGGNQTFSIIDIAESYIKLRTAGPLSSTFVIYLERLRSQDSDVGISDFTSGSEVITDGLDNFVFAGRIEDFDMVPA